MKDKLKNLKIHLKTQIKAAKQIDSKFVYILVTEAEKCLDLAEAEETLLSSPVQTEIEGDGRSTWWYVCEECHGAVNHMDSYCRHCGRRLCWK